MNKKRLDQLDGMRFFMNWIIIISHFEFLDKTVFHDYLLHSSLAVNYFFLLSGFGLYYSMFLKNGSDEPKKVNGFKFAVGKIKKLYVPYVICLLLCSVYRVLTRMGTYGLLKSLAITGGGVAINLTMLQSLVPNKTIAHGVNGVCWFLSTLFICYIFCPWLYSKLRKIADTYRSVIIAVCINILIIAAVTFAAFGIQNFINAKTGKELLDALDYSTPYTRIFYITLGMLMAKLYITAEKDLEKVNIWAARIYGIVLAVISVIYLWKYPVIWRIIPHTLSRIIDVFLCIAVIIGMLINKGFISSLCRLPLVSKMGRDAMYLYLIQFPCIWLTIFIFEKLSLNMPLLQIPVCIVMVFIGGFLLKKVSLFIESKLPKKNKTTAIQ